MKVKKTPASYNLIVSEDEVRSLVWAVARVLAMGPSADSTKVKGLLREMQERFESKVVLAGGVIISSDTDSTLFGA